MQPSTTKIGDLTKEDVGKRYTAHALVTGIRQTKGPTIFTLSDGTGIIMAKRFAGQRMRAFPELEKGMAIKALLELREYNGQLEAEIKEYALLDEPHARQLRARISRKEDEKAAPATSEIFIRSPVLDRLRGQFGKAATMIRKAILLQIPIIVRHHGDCDGFASAVALERAIIPLIREHHHDSQAAYRFYKRSPSRTPYYDYEDASKDVAFALEDEARFGTKRPLIIVADNGSTPDDLLALEKVKPFSRGIIVLDHHYPGPVDGGKCEADAFIDAHINPHLAGGDSSISAGDDCCSLSHRRQVRRP